MKNLRLIGMSILITYPQMLFDKVFNAEENTFFNLLEQLFSTR